MPNWAYYGAPAWRYRDEKGRFASQAQIWKWGDASIASIADEVREGARNLPVKDFEKLMRQMIKGEVIRQYILGIGGKDRLTQADYGSMGGIIADQYRYLDKMIAEYEGGNISQAEVARRAGMYINSTREAYERANAKARDLPQMPAYSGDGGTPCKTNCKCRWEYHWRNNQTECYWVMSPIENCSGCIDHSQEWSPLIVTAEGEFVE